MLASSLAALGFHVVLGSVSIRSYICQPPDVPAITSPADGTTATEGDAIIVKGTATADTSVTLSENGQTYAVVTADQNNTFAAQAQFSVGSHELGLVTTNPCGTNSGDTVTIHVAAKPDEPTPAEPTTPSNPIQQWFDKLFHNENKREQDTPSSKKQSTKPSSTPALALTDVYPLDNFTTTDTSVYFTGRTTIPATEQIVVNDKKRAQIKRKQKLFGVAVPLSVGINQITITAVSGDEKVSLTRVVKREEAKNTKASPNNTPWYRTTPGKIVIGASLFLLLMIVVILVIVW